MKDAKRAVRETRKDDLLCAIMGGSRACGGGADDDIVDSDGSDNADPADAPSEEAASACRAARAATLAAVNSAEIKLSSPIADTGRETRTTTPTSTAESKKRRTGADDIASAIQQFAAALCKNSDERDATERERLATERQRLAVEQERLAAEREQRFISMTMESLAKAREMGLDSAALLRVLESVHYAMPQGSHPQHLPNEHAE